MRPRSGLHISLLCLTLLNMLPRCRRRSLGCPGRRRRRRRAELFAYRADGRLAFLDGHLCGCPLVDRLCALGDVRPTREQTVYILDLAIS